MARKGYYFVFLVRLQNTSGIISLISPVPFFCEVPCFYSLAPSELLVLEVLLRFFWVSCGNSFAATYYYFTTGFHGLHNLPRGNEGLTFCY